MNFVALKISRAIKHKKEIFITWKNETQTLTQTLFDSFDLMAVFEYDRAKQKLLLKANINGKELKFKRSKMIKDEYFTHHKVQKDICFELHHIVPFYYARDIYSLKAIDNWLNLIYIDANSHKIFTLNKSAKKAIRLSFRGKNALLDNFTGLEVLLTFKENILYNTALQQKMQDYNKSLLGL